MSKFTTPEYYTVAVIGGAMVALLLFFVVFTLCILRFQQRISHSLETTRRLEFFKTYSLNVADALPDVLLVLSNEDHIVYANAAATKLSGYTNPLLLTMKLSELLHRNSRHFFGQSLITADGGEIPVKVSRSQVSSSYKPQWCFTVSIHNESELQRELSQRRQSQEKAEQANLAKSQFLSQISHELRTPLNAIVGFSEVLQNYSVKEGVTPSVQQYVKHIHSSSKHLWGLIGDILDINEIEEGEFKLDLHSFNLALLVQQCCNQFMPLAEQKTLQFPNLNDIDPNIWVVGDATRIRQVFENLLDNAFKYTHLGSISVSCGIDVDKDGQGHLSVKIADSGVGIEFDRQHQILAVFGQADASMTRVHDGAGLGLAIAQKLVQSMQGNIQFQSFPNRGSVFNFDVAVRLGSPANTAVAIKLSDLTFLVVDDIELNIQVVEALLEQDHMFVEGVLSGAEAISKVASKHYDVILMDVHMPSMDGMETTRRIRKLECQMQRPSLIIALSADADRLQQQRFLDSGMDAVLSKPLVVGDLKRLVFELLASKTQVVD